VPAEFERTALLEVCVEGVDAAVAAAAAGADRRELCARLDLGGTTPAPTELAGVLERVTVPVHAMVRPRGGDFVYTGEELARMRRELRELLAVGAHGLVLGVLESGGAIERGAMSSLLELAEGLPVTFHRAFDGIPEPRAALETLIELGVTRLLTSGGPARAWEGRAQLRELVEAAGERLLVMPGGGVRQDHVLPLLELTGAREVHSSVVLKL
jgi:copper homeostasis protein